MLLGSGTDFPTIHRLERTRHMAQTEFRLCLTTQKAFYTVRLSSFNILSMQKEISPKMPWEFCPERSLSGHFRQHLLLKEMSNLPSEMENSSKSLNWHQSKAGRCLGREETRQIVPGQPINRNASSNPAQIVSSKHIYRNNYWYR